MGSKKIIISGIGCSLADYLYTGISFSSAGFLKFHSLKTGDGGLSPGNLVFTEELESFAGKSYPGIVGEILGSQKPDAFNVGGPSIVAMIHAGQILDRSGYDVRFYGMSGQDETAGRIRSMLSRTPVDITNYLSTGLHATPFTDVFSDPDHDNGHGERTFVNNIGAAWDYLPEMIDADFFESDIVCFGGTGLVPVIHDNLSVLLDRAKLKQCFTVVNTVFDFRNEKKNPGKPWPLVSNPVDYRLIDLLIMDLTEALKISGTTTVEEAVTDFTNSGVGSFIITNGAQEVVAWSDGSLFEEQGLFRLPVSKAVTDELRSNPERRGDTTGCGDNFTGGVISSVAMQKAENPDKKYRLTEAVTWGIASGGFCCFTIGGTYLENGSGEKRKAVEHLREQYLKQINH
jgi:sugar/nucleoside kinase (ribokinase family)